MTALFADLHDELPEGVAVFRSRLKPDDQRRALDAVAAVIAEAPLFRPQMPSGPYMINSLTNCGSFGWLSDKRGYRYAETHPATGKPWPPIPPLILDEARKLAREAGFGAFEPDACLVNVYAADGKLSLHRDYDEADFKWPIVSFSFGNDADFALGGLKRSDKTRAITLHSGDVMVFGGQSRLRYHGVKRIKPGTSPMAHSVLPPEGRINLTLRRAR